MGYVETKEVTDLKVDSNGLETHGDNGDVKQSTGDTEQYGSAVFEPGEIENVGESTHRGLKSRHAQMIALGGTIGTGLFVGSGATLARGGPAFILLCYIIITVLVLFVVTAITEVAAHLPVAGGTMSYFGFRYASNSLGFAMGWLYWYVFGFAWTRAPLREN